MKQKFIVGIAILVIAVIIIAMFGLPVYRVWQKEKRGEASLREAEWSKKIAIEEAKAVKESAKFRAEAEIERAKGVAEANKIIGESLRENEEYLRYLWILGLQDGQSEVIYVPTEANLPILEATRNLQK
ncbi:hypothetical protein KY335_05305 [Candidatus Woesearchaeota archaeon]|nr:hypothetical protein [Candidatus Woesearchaeota archaeon]MBW3014628.1 hypothetical protein [Candidatus Woesearchaeota archaeon]